MEEKNIRQYAQLMKELDLTALEITNGQEVIRLERGGARTTLEKGPALRVVQEASGEEKKPAENLKEVKSPMVGVFYAAPAENAEPFVSVGMPVRKGDTLCIIEAMKLINEITAEQDGTIAEICVRNGQVVEYGTVLFKLGEEKE